MAPAAKKRKIFDGRYEILSIVGRGACSVVYHARHAVAPGSEVALKVLLNEKDQKSNGEKLRKEALAMVSSRHKYVVRLDDFHSVGELCYLSMEYAPESDVRKYAAKSGGKLNAVQAELFLLQVAEALAFIHRAGIVHRDIKPDNILVVSPKEIRLADFGVAVLPGEKSSLAELQKGVGTMDYMGPEVLEGRTYDAQSDIYALGVTFYELLSGKHPFANAPLVEQLNIRKDGKFPHLREVAPEVPTHLANVIMQSMSYDSSKRFASTKDLAQALLMHKSKPGAPGAIATARSTASQPQRPGDGASTQAAPKATTASAPTPAPSAPSASVLAAVRAAASGLPASAAKSSPEPLPTPPPQKTASAASTPKVPVAAAGSAEAKRAGAQALLGKSSQSPTSVTVSGNAAVQTPTEPSLSAPAQPQAPRAQTSGESIAPPAPAAAEEPRGMTPPQRDVAPTQVMSKETVAEVRSNAKKAENLISRAFNASDAVREERVTQSERAPGLDTPAEAPAETSSTKSPGRPTDTAENKKSTQLITRDLVAQVREGMKGAAPETAGPAKAQESVAETLVLKPEQVAAAAKQKPGKPQPQEKQQREKKQPKEKPAARQKTDLTAPPTPKSEIWEKNPRKSRYLAISMGILLVILWFGNIFLIKTYDIGIGKSLLGLEAPVASPIPSYGGEALAFPRIPSGIYAGTARGILGDRPVPLTLISFGEQRKLAVILGIEGWTPAVVSVDSGSADPGNAEALRVVSNGLVLNMSGSAADGTLRGQFEDIISGLRGEWQAKPVMR